MATVDLPPNLIQAILEILQSQGGMGLMDEIGMSPDTLDAETLTNIIPQLLQQMMPGVDLASIGAETAFPGAVPGADVNTLVDQVTEWGNQVPSAYEEALGIIEDNYQKSIAERDADVVGQMQEYDEGLANLGLDFAQGDIAQGWEQDNRWLNEAAENAMLADQSWLAKMQPVEQQAYASILAEIARAQLGGTLGGGGGSGGGSGGGGGGRGRGGGGGGNSGGGDYRLQGTTGDAEVDVSSDTGSDTDNPYPAFDSFLTERLNLAAEAGDTYMYDFWADLKAEAARDPLAADKWLSTEVGYQEDDLEDLIDELPPNVAEYLLGLEETLDSGMYGPSQAKQQDRTINEYVAPKRPTYSYEANADAYVPESSVLGQQAINERNVWNPSSGDPGRTVQLQPTRAEFVRNPDTNEDIEVIEKDANGNPTVGLNSRGEEVSLTGFGARDVQRMIGRNSAERAAENVLNRTSREEYLTREEEDRETFNRFLGARDLGQAEINLLRAAKQDLYPFVTGPQMTMEWWNNRTSQDETFLTDSMFNVIGVDKDGNHIITRPGQTEMEDSEPQPGYAEQMSPNRLQSSAQRRVLGPTRATGEENTQPGYTDSLNPLQSLVDAQRSSSRPSPRPEINRPTPAPVVVDRPGDSQQIRPPTVTPARPTTQPGQTPAPVVVSRPGDSMVPGRIITPRRPTPNIGVSPSGKRGVYRNGGWILE